MFSQNSCNGSVTNHAPIDDSSETNSKRGDNIPPNINDQNPTTSHSKENQAHTGLKLKGSQPSLLNPRQPSVYQKRISYIPNKNFSGNKSTILQQDDGNSPQVSVPNTFHYKSHPNAKSKELGGSILVEDEQHDSSRQNSQSYGATPQWMPEELKEKWTQSSTNDGLKSNTGNNLLNHNIKSMEFQPSSTVIHNSDIQMKENLPWVSTFESPAEKNLQHIFQDPKETSIKEASASSMASTPVGTMRKISSSSHPVAADFNGSKPQSPLKLYNYNYDTFTRMKLEGVLQNFASNKNTPAQVNNRPSYKRIDLKNPPLIENLQTSNIPSKISIKDFTKTKSYTANAYKINAENVFSEIVKKGHKGQIGRIRSVSKETATSTPKKNPVHTDAATEIHESNYASFSTGYSSEEKSVDNDANEQHKQVSNEFTSITNDSEGEDEMGVDSIHTDVTFKSQLDIVADANVMQGSLYTQDFSNSQSSESEEPVSSRTLESNQPNQSEPMGFDSKYEDSVGTIKLRSVSELRGKFISPLVNGKPQPNISLSHAYPGMVFDPLNQKWISTETQNKTLDNIEDLTDDETDDETELPGILKKANSKAKKTNFEVSFHEPSSFDKSADNGGNEFVAGDVTKVSQLMNVSFSESRRELVSALNDVLELKLEISSWKDVEYIDLSHCDLRFLIDLFEFLPVLKRLKASGNNIKYLCGLPSGIQELDLSENIVEDKSGFSELTNLQRLNLEHNHLTETTNLSRNINLTTLNLSHNSIDDISGLKNLSNLTKLDLSFNKLRTLNLAEYRWAYLEEMNVSNNMIEAIDNINHLGALRVLNCDKNRVAKFDLVSMSLRKLSVNQNNLVHFDISSIKQLLCLRFDGNAITNIQLPRCNIIEEISMKSQLGLHQTWGSSAARCDQLRCLDLSGNRMLPTGTFPLINKLTLSAMNLSHLPNDFANMFPNVQYLNLNFNKLRSIEPLSDLKGLKKLWLLSNKLPSPIKALRCLANSKEKLVSLDLRLNAFSKSLYDYIFAEDEANIDIDLATVDEIEAFTEILNDFDRSEIWGERDQAFCQQLERASRITTIREREVYQATTIMFFKHLRSLDGLDISNAYRREAYVLYRKYFPK
ncbi:NUD1 [Candida margitis]|uniref:NUD1 n=1 Tax=Candida margitis TaxID=1775924 RepID=UPI0022268798|nr:NUD1 [Candida margitis]KAI5969879.1 NUD1 [Candida margitis]